MSGVNCNDIVSELSGLVSDLDISLLVIKESRIILATTKARKLLKKHDLSSELLSLFNIDNYHRQKLSDFIQGAAHDSEKLSIFLGLDNSLVEAHLQRFNYRGLDLFKMVLNEDEGKDMRLQQARESEIVKSSIVDASLDALITIDLDDCIVEFSHAAENMFGWKRDEVIGLAMNEVFVPKNMREAHKKGISGYKKTGQGPLLGKRVEIEALHRSGKLFPVELGLVPIELPDRSLVTAFIRDISEQKKARQELIDAKEKAEAASQSKSRFLSYMSHEIRSPLNAVLSAMELLSQCISTQEQQRYFELAESAGQNLLSVINEVLDFSRIESGYIKTHLEAADTISLIRNVLNVAHVKKPKDEVVVRGFIGKDVPAEFESDVPKVKQIMTIFMDNALKFTERGHIELAIEKDPFTEGNLRFSVSDSGIGIPKSTQEIIFAEFEQVDAIRDTGFGGTGLGLAIAKRFTEALGGEISVTSTEGRGSCFSFSIPVGVDGESRQVLNPLSADGPVAFVSERSAFIDYFERRVALDIGQAVDRVGLRNLQRLESLLTRYQTIYIDVDGFDLVDLKAVVESPLPNYVFIGGDSQLFNSINNRRISHPVDNLKLRSAIAKEQQIVIGERKENLEKYKRITILLVEDVDVNRFVASDLLMKKGFKVVGAKDGLEAIEFFKNQRFDIVLMDLRMPKMNGIEATKAIRKLQYGDAVPIIALSANAEISEIERCRDEGVNEFVSKPFNINHLVKVIDRSLSEDIPDKKSDEHESDESINLMDMSVIRRLVEETSVDTFVQMQALFCQEIEKRIAMLENMSATGSWDGIAEVAHALKSSSGTFGAMILFEQAKSLENLARSESPPIDDIASEAGSLLAMARNVLEKYQSFDFTKMDV